MPMSTSKKRINSNTGKITYQPHAPIFWQFPKDGADLMQTVNVFVERFLIGRLECTKIFKQTSTANQKSVS
jgi:hypothetical protein